MRGCGCYDSCLTNGYLTVPLIIKTLVSPCAEFCGAGFSAKQKDLQGFFFFVFFFLYKRQQRKNKNSEQRLYPPQCYIRPQLVTDGKQIRFHSGWSWIIGHLWRDRRAQGPGAMKQS